MKEKFELFQKLTPENCGDGKIYLDHGNMVEALNGNAIIGPIDPKHQVCPCFEAMPDSPNHNVRINAPKLI